ncbi:hypothetical protein YC2023_088948 [Brassica napus]
MLAASSNVFASVNSVVKFNGLNYGEWFEQIRFTLGVMALDSAILTDEEPSAITVDSSESEKSRYERWERSNRLSLNLMRLTMAESIKPSIPKTEKAREFLEKIKECSQSELADKSIVGSLMNELTTKKFDWSQPIHDHLTHMSNLAAKLTTLGIEVHEQFLVQFIMNSLPLEFSQFQVNYNTIKDKWNFKELKAMLIQEEGRLRKMKDQVANLVGLGSASSSKRTTSRKDKRNVKNFVKGPQSQIQKEKKCFFCKQVGHFKKDCPKRKDWFDKKGKHYSFGFSSIQPIRGPEQYLFMGNRMKAQIEGIGTYRLILDTGSHVDLEGCLYVPECARNLVSLDFSDLDVCIDCIKGKQTKHTLKKPATRSTQLLELIHTDICGPFDAPSWSGEKYFITFIDDYLRYGYTYLLHEKSKSVNVLEVFIDEVERQTATYVLNRVPSKAVPKTPYELWTRRKPSLRHLRVWGCPAEVRLYNPHEKKLDSRTVSGFFIGYPEKSKGYTFYCPNHGTRIVDSGNARFIENGETSGSGEPRKVDINEIQVKVPSPVVPPEVVVPIVASDSNDTIGQHNDELILLAENTVDEHNDKYSKGAKDMELKYLSVKEEVQKQSVIRAHKDGHDGSGSAN